MDRQRKKELAEQYKQIKVYMGVYRLTNTGSGRMLVASSPNLKNREFSLRAQLDMGRHQNAQLQKEWNEQGGALFAYEVLEQKEAKKDTDARWETKQLEKQWLEKLQPFGERGYNKPEMARNQK